MGIGDFFKFAVGLFAKNDEIKISTEQAKLMQELVVKEQAEISLRMHDMVDKGALEGKTIPVRSICGNIDNMSSEQRENMELLLQELVDKYGETMPVNTAHRLSRQWSGEEKTWSDNPGCHERQLRLRDGSLLFSEERRIVLIREILDAQELDSAILQEVKERFDVFCNKNLKELKENNTMKNISDTLKLIQNMLEEMAGIGGNLGRETALLENIETSITKILNENMPDGSDLLKKAHDMSMMARTPYLAESSSKRNVIPECDMVPALLADDLETITQSVKSAEHIQTSNLTMQKLEQFWIRRLKMVLANKELAKYSLPGRGTYRHNTLN